MVNTTSTGTFSKIMGETQFTSLCLAVTALCFGELFIFLAHHAHYAYVTGQTRHLVETLIFAGAIVLVAYGNIIYQACFLVYYKRRNQHRPLPRDLIESLYKRAAPSLSVLVPSYKEEKSVIWQTLVSAALVEYPKKNIVLLIDDPHQPRVLEDMLKLEDTRNIPLELQALFDEAHTRFHAELDAYGKRLGKNSFCHEAELTRLAGLYEEVAGWLETLSANFLNGRTLESLAYTDKFFVDAVLLAPAAAHRERAHELLQKLRIGDLPSDAYLERQYARLAGLFNIRFSSFERKKYSNLSHEANKAMNLNSYIGLIGRSWREVEVDGKLQLKECLPADAHFSIEHADYVNVLDADSIVLSDYFLRLVHMMEQPDNQRLAVIQSPCSSFPGCHKGLERTTGAAIDIQFLVQQGYTHWNATFWVGANAMLRRKALEDIRETRVENGHQVAIYIQDRTVIEDTESTIDLVDKGWKLYNCPERMYYSATPPDFGSLLIQRRRWANGGLIILPKLIRYTLRAPKSLGLLNEFLIRFHYLASSTTGCLIALMCFFYPFEPSLTSPWLAYASIPLMVHLSRDLKKAGYAYSDVFRIYALGLMLVPVITGGVFKQFQQMITGEKIPFGRTPKIPGRTSVPVLYCVIEAILPFVMLWSGYHNIVLGHWFQAAFSFLNAGFITYAVVYYIGVKAIWEDISIACKLRWSKAAAQAEILPMPVGGQLNEVSLAKSA